MSNSKFFILIIYFLNYIKIFLTVWIRGCRVIVVAVVTIVMAVVVVVTMVKSH